MMRKDKDDAKDKEGDPDNKTVRMLSTSLLYQNSTKVLEFPIITQRGPCNSVDW